jgi:hypothetical protein
LLLPGTGRGSFIAPESSGFSRQILDDAVSWADVAALHGTILLTRVAFQKSQATKWRSTSDRDVCHEAAEDGSPPLPFHLGGGGEQANREEQSRVVGGAPSPHRKRTPSIITGYGKSIQMDRGTESYLMESTGNWVNRLLIVAPSYVTPSVRSLTVTRSSKHNFNLFFYKKDIYSKTIYLYFYENTFFKTNLLI